MGSSHDVRKLAELFIEIFEIGSRKAEKDVADEVLEAFDIRLNEIEMEIGLKNGIASKAQDRRRLRELIVDKLLERPVTVEALMNVVGQSTSKFIEMLEAIYEFLASYDATTGGTSEEFRFRLGDLQLDISVSKAFIETIRRYVNAIVQVQVGIIHNDKLMKLLNIDGDFYGSWPIRTFTIDNKYEDTRNIARDINYISWLKREIERSAKASQWNTVKHDIQTLEHSVEQFVGEAQSLIQAHVRQLKKEKTINLEEGANLTDDYESGNKDKERSLLIEHGLLKSGLFSKRVGLKENKKGEWVHVDVERLLSSSNKIGQTTNCLVSMAPEEYQNFHGSPVGALAALCGIWKEGVVRKPDDNSIILKYLEDKDVKKISQWVVDLSDSVMAAAEWLKSEVWEPIGFGEETRIVEISEDYLNLPLWRQRWLLYEIWLLVITIKSAIPTGWKCRIKLDKASKSASTWVLPKGKAMAPCATLTLFFDPSMELEVWYQGRIDRSSIDMMPDVAIRTPGREGRDLVIIEGKDRFRMATQSGKDSALSVGTRYSTSSGAHVTWLVNLCSFSGNSLNDPDFNHGSPWQCLYFAAEMKPGNIPKRFEKSISSSLIPVEHRNFCEDVMQCPQELIFVVDTTGSMHKHLDSIFNRIIEICEEISLKWKIESFWAVLFGDHDQGNKEPYLFEELGPFQDVNLLIQEIKKMPVTSGGDDPEALEDVVLLCRNISERIRKRVAAVVITDASPHSKSECPNGIDFAEEVNKLLDGSNYCLVVKNFLENEESLCWLPFQENRFFKWVDMFQDVGGWFDVS
jgi:hypothetical protein